MIKSVEKQSISTTCSLAKKSKKTLDESSSSLDEDNPNAACIFCNELYAQSRSKEGWIQCISYHGWAHEACTNAEEEDDTFVCDFCS